jgi:hypothetical protein
MGDHQNGLLLMKNQKKRMIKWGTPTTLETSRWTYDPANMGILHPLGEFGDNTMMAGDF